MDCVVVFGGASWWHDEGYCYGCISGRFLRVPITLPTSLQTNIHMKPIKMQMSKSRKPNLKKIDPTFTFFQKWNTIFFRHSEPPPLLHSETCISASSVLTEFTVPGYSPLIVKYDHLKRYGHRLGAYIKNEFPCGRDATHICASAFHLSIVLHQPLLSITFKMNEL